MIENSTIWLIQVPTIPTLLYNGYVPFPISHCLQGGGGAQRGTEGGGNGGAAQNGATGGGGGGGGRGGKKPRLVGYQWGWGHPNGGYVLCIIA